MTSWAEEYARRARGAAESWGGVVAALAVLAFTVWAYLTQR